VSQSFKAYKGKPLTIPAEAAGPKAEYPPSLCYGGQSLEYHRSMVFGK
jgi:hypothetical protein